MGDTLDALREDQRDDRAVALTGNPVDFAAGPLEQAKHEQENAKCGYDDRRGETHDSLSAAFA
jgi:hypothetical protein